MSHIHNTQLYMPNKKLVFLLPLCVTAMLCTMLHHNMRHMFFPPCESQHTVNMYSHNSTSLYNVTIVTAFYDIHRANRDFTMYQEWIKKTLQTPLPFVIFCHQSQKQLVEHARRDYMHITKIVTMNTFPLQGLVSFTEPIAKTIGNGRQWPEWTNPNYIPPVFSKFIWLINAMLMDEFNTSHFYWFDAGISRFFRDGYPLDRQLEIFTKLPTKGVAIMISPHCSKERIQKMQTSDVIVGSQEGVIQAGIFGGSKQSMQLVCNAMMTIFTEYMLARGRIDNEQIGLAVLFTQYRHWFQPLYQDEFSYACNVICM